MGLHSRGSSNSHSTNVRCVPATGGSSSSEVTGLRKGFRGEDRRVGASGAMSSPPSWSVGRPPTFPFPPLSGEHETLFRPLFGDSTGAARPRRMSISVFLFDGTNILPFPG